MWMCTDRNSCSDMNSHRSGTIPMYRFSTIGQELLSSVKNICEK